MNENTCLYCGEVIPEGRQVCWSCGGGVVKVGSILQSCNATEDKVEEAYFSLQNDEEEIVDGED